MQLSQAAQHEETRTHRSFVNELNDVQPAPSSPFSPTQRASDLPSFDRLSSPLPQSSPLVYPDDELPDLCSSAGPWLPEDDPNGIFDDYGGPYGAQMPSPEDPRVSGHEDKEHDSEADLSDSEAEEFEGEGEVAVEGEGEDDTRMSAAEQQDYFGPSVELEDLTEHESLAEDWWPWETREVCSTIQFA